MADEWTLTAPEPDEGEFTFTAHLSTSRYAFTRHTQDTDFALQLHSRAVQVESVRAAQQGWAVTRHQRRVQAVTAAQADWTAWAFQGQRRDYDFTPSRWETQAVRARVVRALRRRGQASEDALHAEVLVWGGEEIRPLLPALAHHPLTFVEVQRGLWTLTPWVRLGAAFRPTLTTLPGQTNYERWAAEFWIGRRQRPGPEEEWHPGVRQVVEHALSTGPVPDCFDEHPQGTFQQATGLGVRRLRLNVDRLPEGRHFTWLNDHGDLTYSAEGRAFLVDGPDGAQVVSQWAGVRWREALLYPEDEPGLVWHPVGLRLKKACRAAKVQPLPL